MTCTNPCTVWLHCSTHSKGSQAQHRAIELLVVLGRHLLARQPLAETGQDTVSGIFTVYLPGALHMLAEIQS